MKILCKNGKKKKASITVALSVCKSSGNNISTIHPVYLMGFP